MPPYKKPTSLFKLSLKAVAHLVNSACKTLAKDHGQYYTCQPEIDEIQCFLSQSLPTSLLDQVCWERTTINIDYDPRINIAAYMHKGMKKFKIGDVRKEIKLFHDSSFWLSKLPTLTSIIFLDLCLICTDEILEVIGQHCHRLQFVNIVSKMMAHSIFFNALKIKLFVSDYGLAQLENCKDLEEIIMNRVLRSQFAERALTYQGIRKLLRNLPLIKKISFNDMGRVISDDMDDVESLSLTHFCDHHPEVRHICMTSKLCSDLQDLELHLPGDTTKEASDSILDALTESRLHVSVLDLVHFTTSNSLINMISFKGQFLTSLLLVTDTITETLVNTVGRFCPNINSLYLKEIRPDGTVKIRPDGTVFLENFISPSKMFLNLESLVLCGKQWSPEVFLPMLLLHAHRMKKIQLFTNADDSLDKVVNEILLKNKLIDLVELCVNGILSMNTILYFFYCPNIKLLEFKKHRGIASSVLESLEKEIAENNFDIIVNEIDSLHSL